MEKVEGGRPDCSKCYQFHLLLAQSKSTYFLKVTPIYPLFQGFCRFACFLFTLVCLFFFLSCGKDDSSTPPMDEEMEEDMEEMEDMEDMEEEMGSMMEETIENYLNFDSDFIFDQDVLPTFELNLPDESLQLIDSDPAAEQYVEASLTFNGETLDRVGLRYKGSIGAFVNCLSGSDFFEPSGFKTCQKLSMKVKINWENSSDKFYGLKKLQFHSMNNDPSQMRERLAYWLFREMGVPAPRSIHARLVINGEYQGLFALVEQIDGPFCNYHFDDGDGNLYQEIWPLSYQGQAHNLQNYLEALKTNEEQSQGDLLIRSFAQQLSNATDNQVQQLVLENMDMSETLSMIAVDRTIRADDGPFHWYCNPFGCTPHNFYWYENPGTNKLHLIPWDMDLTFQNIIFNQNPVTSVADDFGETSNNCQPFTFGGFGLAQWSATCDKLTAAWADFDVNYQQKLNEFKNGPLSFSQADVMLDKWEAQIQDATLEADDLYIDALNFSEWQSKLAELRGQIEHARSN